MNYLQFIYYAADYGVSVWRQLRFINHYLKPLVNKHLQQIEYQLSKKEKKKVEFYYPLFNHIVNCENYLGLKGRRLNADESKRLAILSVMATLYDDLIDEENWTQEQYFQILDKSLPTELLTPKVRFIYALDDELHNIWKPTLQYSKALKTAIHWQVISAKQLQPDITLDEILHISENKCGNSSLLWASVLDEEWTEQEMKVIFQSGFVGQLVNDLFDAFKDREDGIFTFVRKTNSVAQAQKLFIEQCTLLNTMINSCNTNKSFKQYTIRRMACIHAFGVVALNHLQNTENKYGKPLNWALPLRKELVTDIAFWRNKFKLLPATIFLSKL